MATLTITDAARVAGVSRVRRDSLLPRSGPALRAQARGRYLPGDAALWAGIARGARGDM